jgi:hypothetical protein
MTEKAVNMTHDLNRQDDYRYMMGYPKDVKGMACDNVQHPHGNHENGMKQFMTGEFTKPTFAKC